MSDDTTRDKTPEEISETNPVDDGVEEIINEETNKVSEELPVEDKKVEPPQNPEPPQAEKDTDYDRFKNTVNAVLDNPKVAFVGFCGGACFGAAATIASYMQFMKLYLKFHKAKDRYDAQPKKGCIMFIKEMLGRGTKETSEKKVDEKAETPKPTPTTPLRTSRTFTTDNDINIIQT